MSDLTNSTHRANGQSGHRPLPVETKHLEDHSLKEFATAPALLAKNRES
jgi:hypothetical protein